MPSSRTGRDTIANGHVTTEARLLPASNFATPAVEGRSEQVLLSPSPLAPQPSQCADIDSLVNGVEISPPVSPSSIPPLKPAPDNVDDEVQITALPELSLVYEPERLGNSERALEEHTFAMHPQLASIPEETTEKNAEEDPKITHSRVNSVSASITTPSKLPDESYRSDLAARIDTAPSMSAESPLQAHAAPQTFLEAQYISNHVIPTSSDTPPYSEDLGDSSSVASTGGERNSVFDDDYYSDTSNYTASLLSDVKNYAYENGRRYHSYREGHYVLPNDEQEQDRQDLLHHVRNLALNGALFRAPVDKNIQRALDIGTGTGIWAIDFADSFPSAEVIGTDLSPIQPSWVPPNLQFLVDDAESPWLYSAGRPFDFIHARDLGGAIANWPRLLRQAYEHLRPGGWIELQEFEVTLRSDDESLRLAPTLCEFLGQLHEASEAFHRPMNIAEGHRQRLMEAGFEDVRDEVYKVRHDFRC
ncbi:uncharacterized protein N7477_003154 [Penicillium maclennaniae]|uniref:uncharacterized protein n=1 Tax=Penicillium maclennaniae TaxID=1343394 RepID=UPI002541A5DA|nr:uncharacterized protein N7477_003154 [Penicillium maclennaniae]KAJ5677521.1 hypothetical protein N7477_003154 [Penicillium maclennaniae]